MENFFSFLFFNGAQSFCNMFTLNFDFKVEKWNVLDHEVIEV